MNRFNIIFLLLIIGLSAYSSVSHKIIIDKTQIINKQSKGYNTISLSGYDLTSDIGMPDGLSLAPHLASDGLASA